MCTQLYCRILFWGMQTVCNKNRWLKCASLNRRIYSSPSFTPASSYIKGNDSNLHWQFYGDSNSAIVCRTGGFTTVLVGKSYPGDLSSGQHELGLGYGRLHWRLLGRLAWLLRVPRFFIRFRLGRKNTTLYSVKQMLMYNTAISTLHNKNLSSAYKKPLGLF